MATEVQITVLCDNHAQNELQTEHGFAVWMHSAELDLLFDTGSGETLIHNADKLDIRLNDCQWVVLSHGHYDHSGGLSALWRLGVQCPVLAHPSVILPRYSRHSHKPVRSIGMPTPVVTQLWDLPPQMRLWCLTAQMLTPYWGTSGEIPRQDTFEDVGGPFFLDAEGFALDNIEDDLALWLNTPRGLVIVLGCCHSGLINTIAHIRRQTGVNKVAGVVGGLHLLHADEPRLAHTLDFLRRCQLDFLRPGHCTGDAVIERLQRQLPDVDVKLLHVGARYNIKVLPVTTQEALSL
ncbi:MBL fold metallo-hydrolase [Brenneria uluponensis]|uniref:MBL fold metallo-hydrolase n=1 Tax=Brenneria uluponensis TaxID=3057057 RepID=UPI0028E8448F|nr:MBL fold metallo-hydrolase [Brenneria ulupoensis]